MDVGTKLVEWRRKNGITQRAAAKLLGVEQPTWHGYENGKTPSARKLSRLIEITGGAVSAADFAESDEDLALAKTRRKTRTVITRKRKPAANDTAAKAS